MKVTITNPDKILFPGKKITKGDLIEYYKKIAPTMLPYVRQRAVTMHRFPDGIKSEGFYQKDVSDYFPQWIKRVKIKKHAGGSTDYVVCNDKNTLMYLANQACITPHLWLSKIDKLDYPDRMIFDLDPGSKTSFRMVCATAQQLKELLEGIGLTPFVMTTGSRGLHVTVPLKRTADFDFVRSLARDIASVLAEHDQKNLTTEIRLNKRKGRLYIDSGRNAATQTAVAPYAVRAKEDAPVATPLQWKELSNARLTAQSYTIKNIFNRLKKVKDPWKGMLRYAGSAKAARKKLDKLSL